METIINALKTSHHAENPALLLHSLSFINDHAFLLTLAKKIKDRADTLAHQPQLERSEREKIYFGDRLFLKEVDQLAEKAIKINKLMHQNQFDYDQAMWFLNSHELRIILICLPSQLTHSSTNLPLDAFILVLSYVACAQEKEVKKLFDAFTFTKHKSCLQHDLIRFTKSSIFPSNRHAAIDLKKRLPHVCTKADLQTLIKSQRDSILKSNLKQQPDVYNKKKISYEGIIEKHYKRLS